MNVPLDRREAEAFVLSVDPSMDPRSAHATDTTRETFRAAVVMMLCAGRDSNNAYAIAREARYELADVEQVIRNLKANEILRTDRPGELFVDGWDDPTPGVAMVSFCLHAMTGAGLVHCVHDEVPATQEKTP